jgi:hypothetical protein
VSRFVEHAQQIMDAAESASLRGETCSEMTILIAPDGGIRLVADAITVPKPRIGSASAADRCASRVARDRRPACSNPPSLRKLRDSCFPRCSFGHRARVSPRSNFRVKKLNLIQHLQVVAD